MNQSNAKKKLTINTSKATEPPVDLVFLSRQTGENESLIKQLLSLFQQQSSVYVDRLKQSDNAETWHRHCHGFKGSSREIGAFSLANLIESLERKTDEQLEQKSTFIQKIEANLMLTNQFILKMNQQ